MQDTTKWASIATADGITYYARVCKGAKPICTGTNAKEVAREAKRKGYKIAGIPFFE